MANGRDTRDYEPPEASRELEECMNKLKQCIDDRGELENILDSLKSQIEEKTKSITRKDIEIAKLKEKVGEKPPTENGTGPEISWPDRIAALLKLLDEKKYGPLVEHALSLAAGALAVYGIK
jgi:hypothetical protein